MPARATAGAPAASIIVLACNAASVIRGCLDAIAAQVCDDRFDVIVVWSGDQATPDIVSREYPQVTLVGQPQRLRTGATRNLGLAHARGEVIAFVAADCRVEPGWIAARLAAHREGFRLVGGAVLCAPPASRLARANHFVEYSLVPPGRPREVVNAEPLYNLSFRREVFDVHGAYEPELTCGEDSHFNWKLVEAGEAALFDPSIRMHHPGPAGLRDYLGHQFRHGVAFGVLCRRPDYRGRRLTGRRAQLMLAAYPLVRLRGIVQRTARWDRENLGLLLLLAPIVMAGIGAATFGVVAGWRRSGITA